MASWLFYFREEEAGMRTHAPASRRVGSRNARGHFFMWKLGDPHLKLFYQSTGLVVAPVQNSELVLLLLIAALAGLIWKTSPFPANP